MENRIKCFCFVTKTFQISEIKKIRNRTQNVLMETFDVFTVPRMKSSVGPCGKNTDHDLFVHKAKLSQSARFVGEIDLLSDMLETIC